MRCIERKVRLSGEEVTYECDLLALEKDYGVVRYLIQRERAVDGLKLPAGTVTLGLYFSDRPYNLYYWIAPRSASATQESPRTAPAATAAGDAETAGPWSRDIAYYFNIAEPLDLTPATIAYRDLVVDVLVLPDGSARVLDEEELPGDIDSRLRERISRTRDEILSERTRIIAEARERLLPFALEE